MSARHFFSDSYLASENHLQTLTSSKNVTTIYYCFLFLSLWKQCLTVIPRRLAQVSHYLHLLMKWFCIISLKVMHTIGNKVIADYDTTQWPLKFQVFTLFTDFFHTAKHSSSQLLSMRSTMNNLLLPFTFYLTFFSFYRSLSCRRYVNGSSTFLHLVVSLGLTAVEI